MKKLFFIPLFFLITLYDYAQFNRQTITNFTSKDYGVQYSNYIYSLACDSGGFIYAGTAYGILQYDGYTWNFIPVKSGKYVTSLAVCHNTVYVGCNGDFGYLKIGNNGKWNYISLANQLSSEDRFFTNIWKIIPVNDTVYFQAEEAIFGYNKRTIHVIKPQTSFHLAFAFNNVLLARERQKGLLEYRGGKFRIMEQSDMFADTGVFAVLSRENNLTWFVTQEAGIFQWKEPSFLQLLDKAQIKMFSDALLIGALCLNDGNIALYTLKQGIYILSPDLSVMAHYSVVHGLRSNEIHDLLQDKEGNIWVATQKGISRIQYTSPVSFYSERDGLSGNVQAIQCFHHRYYVATTEGLFVINDSMDNNYKEMNAIKGSIWSLEKDENSLWAGGDNGIWRIDSKDIIRQVSKEPCSALLFLKERKQLVSTGSYGCFIWNTVSEKKLIFIPQIKMDAYGMAYQMKKNGAVEIWIGSKSMGVCQLILDNTCHANMEFYKGAEDGLPNEWTFPYKINHDVWMATATGFFTFIRPAEMQKLSGFDSTVTLKGYFDRINYPKNIHGKAITAIYSDSENTYAAFENYIFYIDKDSVATNHGFKTIEIGRFNTIQQINKHLWIGGDDGLAIVALSKLSKLNTAKPSFRIREISVSADSVLWYGDIPFVQKNITLTYQYNQLTIKLMSLYIDNTYQLQYSWKLEGSKQSDYTSWSENPVISFNALKEGQYVLYIKARNMLDVESNEIALSIKILPPWYRSWWAYVLYVISGLAFIYLCIYLNSRRLIEKNKKLEEVVRIRTQEVVLQKEEIRIQKDHIEAIHKDITDSINYAERIQRSFLATTEWLNTYLKEYFIFYQPKDVVSGDFYWAGLLKNGRFALMVADSTGHGVPGAFMSILNITSIEKAVEMGSCEPSEMLNETRRAIIERLKKDGSPEGGKDGMDASLLCFDFDRLTFTYAAANNPVWVVRENTLIELLPDKMPVGKHDKDNVSFTQHEFICQKGDVIYLMSDGFEDQFGGPNNKKFKSKQLKELLTSIALLPIAEQKQKIADAFASWKGNLEQVDDVTLLGIKT